MSSSDKQDFVKLVSEILRIPPNDIVDSLDMESTGTWDSLSHMQLIVAIEGEYGIELSADEIVSMRTIGSIKQILQLKRIEV